MYLEVQDSGGWGDTHTDRHMQKDTHINTMTWPGLGAGPSEKMDWSSSLIQNKLTKHVLAHSF